MESLSAETARAAKQAAKQAGLGGFVLLGLLGGSWVVISRVISRIAIVITYIRGLMTPLITTLEPPIRASGVRGLVLRV